MLSSSRETEKLPGNSTLPLALKFTPPEPLLYEITRFWIENGPRVALAVIVNPEDGMASAPVAVLINSPPGSFGHELEIDAATSNSLVKSSMIPPDSSSSSLVLSYWMLSPLAETPIPKSEKLPSTVMLRL